MNFHPPDPRLWFFAGTEPAEMPIGGDDNTQTKILRAIIRGPDGWTIEELPTLRINGVDVPRSEYVGRVLLPTDVLMLPSRASVEVTQT